MPELTKVQTGFIEPQSPLELDSGTQSAPSIHFEGDENTGLYKAAEDEIGVSIGGTEKYKFTSEGLKFNGTSLDGSPHIGKIDKDIADTAVDVFVYDTSRDSDGGAWRKRTQHTSWYNETLGTATRGTRKEFPAVAVLVLSANKLTIYDGDDPDLPMWMEVYQYVGGGNSGTTTNWHGGSGTFSGVAAINGIIICGTTGTRNLHFVNDRFSLFYSPSSGNYTQRGGISNRNVAYTNWGPSDQYYAQLVNTTVNDVAMTVLPTAPIDPDTGLPIPTIAVATNGGTSVIKDDGTVVDLNVANRPYSSVYFSPDNLVWAVENPGGVTYDLLRYFEVPTVDITTTASYGPSSNPALFPSNTKGNIFDSYAYGSPVGLTIIDHADGTATATSGMVVYIASDYNTGWMHGSIKGAFLSDTDTTNASPGSNLITSGDFSSSTGWTLGTGWTISGGKLNKTTSDNNTAYYTATGLTVGKAYTFSIDVDTVGGSGTMYFYALGVYTTNPSLTTTGSHSLTVVANATSMQFGITGVSGNGSVLDNASLTIGESDRSVNNNGLQVFGTITKTAVATGAELVAYSGFSASNYLEQPYNSDMEFGTGDFYMMAWIKTGDNTNNQKIITRDLNNSNRCQFYTAGNFIQFYIQDPGGYSYLQSITEFNQDVWMCYLIGRSGGTLQMYVNGKFESGTSSNANVARNLSFGAGTTLEIGRSNTGTTNYFRGSIALARIGAGFPSAEQIKKIYNDEKVLFQENAKATLHGSSDAVTALAYDEATNLLHVGTSSGRSDFSGLRQINNTTEEVTTVISAHDGSIAQQ